MAQRANGPEALEFFRKDPKKYVLVLLDMTMPKMSGEEVLVQLRQIRSDIPVILTSGYNEAEATNRFVGHDLAGFIQKPYQMTTLMAKVREVLEK